MKIHLAWFNIIFAVSLSLAGAGCSATGAKGKLKKEDISTIRFHAESHSGLPGRTFVAKIGERNPFDMVLKNDPFLTEANVLRAEAWDTTDGGVAIRLELDRVGRRTLQIQSALLKGQRVAVLSHFPESRWISVAAADELGSDGVVVLYPAVTAAEADRIVKGLNLVAQALEEDRDEEDRTKEPKVKNPSE